MALAVTQVADGTWGTVSVTVPDWLEDLRDNVNTVFELINLALEIANLALEFAKTFLVAFIDPVSAIVEAIIQEINSFIEDFRQIGLYLGGDYGLLEWPFPDLKGGFTAYENRMIARLSDRSDPTRPNVSSQMDVLGFFTYLSVEADAFDELVSFISGLVRLFGMSIKTPSYFPVPLIQEVLYGTEAVSLANPSTFAVLGSFTETPDMARITWKVQPTGGKNPYNPIPQVGPPGFVVTISTFEQPIALWYNRPAKDPGKQRKEGDEQKPQQSRDIGQVLDSAGTPVHLYGGAEMLAIEGSSLQYTGSFNSNGTIKDGKGFVFGRVDPNSNAPLPLEALKSGDIYFFQRTFFVDASWALAQWFTSEYNITIPVKDLPHRGRPILDTLTNEVTIEDDGVGGTYYVRVACCSAAVGNQTVSPKWSFTDLVAEPQASQSPAPFRINFTSGLASVGPFSAAKPVMFPATTTRDYLNALESALLVLALSRSDLPSYEELLATRSEAFMAQVQDGTELLIGAVAQLTGLESAKPLFDRLFPDPSVLVTSGGSPLNFRSLLRRRIQQLARDIYRKTGPIPEVEAAVVAATENLRTVTWNDLLGSISYETEPATAAPDTGGLLNEEGAAFLGLTATTAKTIQPMPLIEGTTNIGDVTLMGALSDSADLGTSTGFGVASNIYSMGVFSQGVIEAMFFRNYALVGRTPDFFIWSNGEPEPVVSEAVGDAAVARLLQDSHPFFARLYEGNVTEDPDTGEAVMRLPEEQYRHLTTLVTQRRMQGSYDRAPVFMLRPDTYSASGGEEIYAIFCRHLFRQYQDGVLYREARTALQTATSAFARSPQDGEWIAIRLFDAFPEMDNFLSAIEQWVRSLASALESVADTIIKYIEFLQAAIADLQAFLRRINALIQSFLAFTITLPSFGGLMLRSKGTDNLLADFVGAQNKPQDSPMAYGAGIVAVAVSPIPLWLIDLIFLIQDGPPEDGGTSFSQPPAPVGIEQVQPIPSPSPDPDPL